VLIGVMDFCHFASSSSFLTSFLIGEHWDAAVAFLGVCALGVVPDSTLLHMVAHGCGIDNKGPTSEGMV